MRKIRNDMTLKLIWQQNTCHQVQMYMASTPHVSTDQHSTRDRERECFAFERSYKKI